MAKLPLFRKLRNKIYDGYNKRRVVATEPADRLQYLNDTQTFVHVH